jgi:hypothetical protein
MYCLTQEMYDEAALALAVRQSSAFSSNFNCAFVVIVKIVVTIAIRINALEQLEAVATCLGTSVEALDQEVDAATMDVFRTEVAMD